VSPRSEEQSGVADRCNRSQRYHHGERVDLLDWLGGRYPRVLEIGCGRGGNAAWYRCHGASRIVGIEVDEASAEEAKGLFDAVYAQPVETSLPRLTERFDLIVCADVLEHLIDPWTVLGQLRGVADPGATLVLSIPNIRHYRALLQIAFGAGFRYEAEGPFDKTHIRFFTRANLVEMLGSTGWRSVRVAPAPGGRLRRLRLVLSRLHADGVHEWFV